MSCPRAHFLRPSALWRWLDALLTVCIALGILAVLIVLFVLFVLLGVLPGEFIHR